MQSYTLKTYMSTWLKETSKFIRTPDIEIGTIIVPSDIYSGLALVSIKSSKLGNIILKYPYTIAYELPNADHKEILKTVEIARYMDFSLILPKDLVIYHNYKWLKIKVVLNTLQRELSDFLDIRDWEFLRIPRDLLDDILLVILKISDGIMDASAPVRHKVNDNGSVKMSYATSFEGKILINKKSGNIKFIVERNEKEDTEEVGDKEQRFEDITPTKQGE